MQNLKRSRLVPFLSGWVYFKNRTDVQFLFCASWEEDIFLVRIMDCTRAAILFLLLWKKWLLKAR
jgi:hypothetical protein